LRPCTPGPSRSLACQAPFWFRAFLVSRLSGFAPFWFRAFRASGRARKSTWGRSLVASTRGRSLVASTRGRSLVASLARALLPRVSRFAFRCWVWRLPYARGECGRHRYGRRAPPRAAPYTLPPAPQSRPASQPAPARPCAYARPRAAVPCGTAAGCRAMWHGRWLPCHVAPDTAGRPKNVISKSVTLNPKSQRDARDASSNGKAKRQQQRRGNAPAATARQSASSNGEATRQQQRRGNAPAATARQRAWRSSRNACRQRAQATLAGSRGAHWHQSGVPGPGVPLSLAP